jgi:hypothetical protein
LRSANFDDLDLLQVLANMTRGQDPPIATGVLKCAIRVHSGRGEFFAETASIHPGAWTANHPGGPHPGYLALLSEKSPHLDDVRSGVSSIEVWIAVLDSSAAAVLQQTGQWEALETFLPDAQPETWDVRINDMTSLPGLARESFRVLRKQIPIP